jgi:hypothetical protein
VVQKNNGHARFRAFYHRLLQTRRRLETTHLNHRADQRVDKM